MKSWTYVYFTSTLPDNTRWDETESDIIEPGGKAPLEKIAEHMRSDGFNIDKVYQRSFYGWEFTARNGSLKFHIVIQYADFDSHLENCWLLQICPRRGLFRGWVKNEDETAIAQLKIRLLADDDFANFIWMNYEENELYDKRRREKFLAAARARDERSN